MEKGIYGDKLKKYEGIGVGFVDGYLSSAFYSKEFLQGLKYTKEGFKYFDPEEIEVLAKQVGFSKIIIEPSPIYYWHKVKISIWKLKI